MQHFTAGKQRGQRRAACGCRQMIAGDRQSAECEHRQGRRNAGEAEILVMFALPPFEPGKYAGKGKKGGWKKKNVLGCLCESRDRAAEQAGDAISADAGRAAAFGRLAFAPSPFEADQESDRQCEAEPQDERFHADTTACNIISSCGHCHIWP